VSDNPIRDKPNPAKLYTLNEVAAYCKLQPQTLRLYFCRDWIADPTKTKMNEFYKTRRFTLHEARTMKNFFQSSKKNYLRPAKKRAQHRSDIRKQVYAGLKHPEEKKNGTRKRGQKPQA
jgi:hypothetical protein